MLPEETRIQALRLMKMYPFPGSDVTGMIELLDAGYRMEFEHGNTICSEGEPAHCMYILTWGKVGVIRSDFSGRSRRVATMHSPSVFGHMSMVDGSKRSATCVAEGKVAVIVVDREVYTQLVSAPTLAGRTLRRMLLSSLTDQLAKGNKRLRELTGGTVTQELTDDETAEHMIEVSSKLEGWHSEGLSEEDERSLNDADGPVSF